ncbi:MAG: tetratricopeptide repeat protein [Rhodocyclaceae bacterium]
MRSPNIGPILARRAGLALVACLLPILASGASLQDTRNLLSQGKPDRALLEADKLLASTPRDRELRLLRGVILTELNRLDEAAEVFVGLSREAPELPQPYNNLAVVYARQQQYDKAGAALDKALRTNTAYSTAYHNLNEVYAQMARQAYDKALQGAGTPRPALKLALLAELGGGVAEAPSPRPVAVAANASSATASRSASSAAVASSMIAASQAASSAARATSSAAASLTVSAPPPMPAAASSSSRAAASAVASSAASSKAPPVAAPNAESDIRRAVQDWADAWSRKDVAAYLAAYGRDFQVPGGGARTAWEQERRDRITKPGRIQVRLSKIQVALQGDSATVRFRQAYSSSNFDATSGKTLIMTRQGAHWLIQQERVGR